MITYQPYKHLLASDRSRLLRQGFLAAGFLLFLSACGGEGGSNGGGQPFSILDASPSSSAVASLQDVPPVPAEPEDIEGEILLSRISVVLKNDAKVADLNAAALAAGSKEIVFSRPNSPFLTLAVPRQSSGAELAGLAAGLRDLPGILLAAPGREMAAAVLPVSDQPAVIEQFDHLLPTGFPAAWNVSRLAQSGCASRKVTVLVPDFYRGAAPPIFDSQVPGASANFNPLSAGENVINSHGYEVSAILAGKFDAVAPTGANPFPDCLKVIPVELSGMDFFQSVDAIRSAVADATRNAATAANGKVVVNGSVGYSTESISLSCGPDQKSPCAAADVDEAMAGAIRDHLALRVAQGIAWAQFAMQPSFVDNTLLSAAAGDDQNRLLGQLYPGLRRAQFGTPFAMATQLSNLPGLLSDTTLWGSADPTRPTLLLDSSVTNNLIQEVLNFVPNSITDRNLTIVGSTTNARFRSQLQRSAFSDEGADLNAVGEKVTGLDLKKMDGTSFSAPQVAGLASYLWLLDNDLRAQPVSETVKLIRGTSRSNGAVTGIVDAYGAVLGLDSRSRTPRIRKELLDINGDGTFDHLDLLEFARAYQLNNPKRLAVPPAADYSRFDLNGDGFTGGDATDQFDLDLNGVDANGAPIINTVTTTIEGQPVTMNEAALTDLEILCYYAYATDPNPARPGAPLVYSSSPQAISQRTNILGPGHCVGTTRTSFAGRLTQDSRSGEGSQTSTFKNLSAIVTLTMDQNETFTIDWIEGTLSIVTDSERSGCRAKTSYLGFLDKRGGTFLNRSTGPLVLSVPSESGTLTRSGTIPGRDSQGNAICVVNASTSKQAQELRLPFTIIRSGGDIIALDFSRTEIDPSGTTVTTTSGQLLRVP